MVFKKKNKLEGVFTTAVFKERIGVEAEMGSALQSWRSVPGSARAAGAIGTRISPGQANCCRPARGADGACSHANHKV